jgi:H+-transporting ATPase
MEQKIACLRDGKADHINTRLLVPGDVVLLIGGCQVPADIEWLEGDVLSVDTAALTGEPLPRKYPSDEYGKLILCASTIRAGEAYGIVRKTGIHTEIGSANADIMKDKTQAKVSVFEQKVLMAVKIIILISLIDVFAIFFIQGFVVGEFSNGGIKTDLLTCLSIIIAAIPVALPIVLQVTMALGAGKMAREYDAVVTSLPALQDISSMTILCSDKTGTLTTAKISIHAESVWCTGTFTKRDVALYAALASSRDKKEDAIDRSVIGHFDRVFGANGIQITNEYTKVRNVGFNPIYKRVLYEYTHPKIGKITIAKGLPNKILDTADGGEDDAADQWKVQDAEKLKAEVKKVDYDFSKAGYKTLGVVIKINDGPFTYCGILPMLDPPRHDTAQTIKNLVNAGIEVKMITGDHLNIAKETARLIGMGVNIHPGEATRDGSQDTYELIRNANGFAQVLPKDKREVVLVLRNVYGQVCGMTGDGVNDAPALSAAQCGVAVDDATDAAKNAAAIILTSPGLSAIYSAVVESRRIFRKLKAYVTYRFAATIQIVFVLTLIIFISNCALNPTFVIIMALLNDITMLPIAYDVQQASAIPEKPVVWKMLLLSAGLGCLETVFSLIFAYGADPSGLFQGNFPIVLCPTSTQGAIWLQMFLSAELLIFVTRAPKLFIFSLPPSIALFISVLLGCILVSLLAGLSQYFGGLQIQDIVIIWAYDLLCLILMDLLKVGFLAYFDEVSEVLPDQEETGSVSDKPKKENHHKDVEAGTEVDNFKNEGGEDISRASVSANRLTEWAEKQAGAERFSSVERPSRVGGPCKSSTGMMTFEANKAARESLSLSSRISVAKSVDIANGAELRPSLISSGSLRPTNIPQNRKKF